MKIRPGASTAYPFNVQYRIGRIAKYLDCGEWLDYGCASGGYTDALLQSGAATVTGVDVAIDRIEAARKAHPHIRFSVIGNDQVPFPGGSFDGVFTDEDRTLEEVYRVLRPGGHLLLYRQIGDSPSRATLCVSGDGPHADLPRLYLGFQKG